jgi:hypothetical protein
MDSHPRSLEAKYACADITWKIKLIWTRAGAGRLRRSCDSPDIAKGEWAQRTVPGEIVFVDYFLTLWNDADADIPVLRQARAQYAKL